MGRAVPQESCKVTTLLLDEGFVAPGSCLRDQRAARSMICPTSRAVVDETDDILTSEPGRGPRQAASGPALLLVPLRVASAHLL